MQLLPLALVAISQQDLTLPGGVERAPRDLTAQFEVAPNVKVQEFALTPLFYNPAAIDVDEKSRVWVAEAVNYRQWNGRNPGKHFDAGDRVVIVSDEDGDGICDPVQSTPDSPVNRERELQYCTTAVQQYSTSSSYVVAAMQK